MAKQAKVDAYKKDFYKAVNQMKRRNDGFTVDDIVGKIGNPPQGRRALSGFMTAAAHNYGLSPVDVVPSSVPSRKSSLVTVWG